MRRTTILRMKKTSLIPNRCSKLVSRSLGIITSISFITNYNIFFL